MELCLLWLITKGVLVIVEEWKSVNGYEGYYEVSNFGRVKALNRKIVRSNGVVQNRKEYIKKPIKTKDGYLEVGLSKNGEYKKFLIHRLVAESFVDGYFDGAEVNHKDFDRNNNSYKNLEWVSHTDNVYHSSSCGRYKKQYGADNPNYGNRKLSKFYSENKDIAKQKQSRSGAQNGMSKPLTVIFKDGTTMNFDYIGECAEYIANANLSRSKNIKSICASISKALDKDKLAYGLRIISR